MSKHQSVKSKVCFVVCWIFSLLSSPVSANLSSYHQDLLAKYSFNNGSTVNSSDHSTWSRDLTLNGDAAEIADGKFGYSLAFDGTGDYAAVTAAEIGAFNTDHYSYSLWIKPTALGTAQAVIGNHRSCSGCGTPGGYGLFINANKRLGVHTWRASDQTLQIMQSSAELVQGEWAHIAVTFDGTTVQLYVDGTPDSSSTALAGDTVAPSPYPMTIGTLAFQAPTWSPYSGEVDEVRIYGRGLTAAEVGALNIGAGGEPGGTLYESFDDETDAQNENGYVNNGRNANFVAGAKFAGGLQIDDINGVWLDVQNKLDMGKGTISFYYRPDWNAPGGINNTLLQTDNFCDSNAALFRLNTTSSGSALAFQYHGNGTWEDSKSVSTSSMEPDGVGTFASGKWHKIEVMWDTNGTELGYMIVLVDGIVGNIQYTSAVTTGSTNQPDFLSFGRYGSCGVQWNFKGTIDELKILNDVDYDLSDPVGEYVRRARDDGKLQAHETRANSPSDWNEHETTLGSSTFYTLEQFEFTGDGHVPDNGENTAEPFEYEVAAKQTESLFFNYYSDTDHGDVTASVVNGEFVKGTDILTLVNIRTVKNWFQSGIPQAETARLIPIYMPELLLHDSTVDIGAQDWRAVDDDGNGNLSANLPSFTLNNTNLTKANITADTTTQFVVNVNVPEDTPAGTYTAQVELLDDSSAVIDTLDINLEVLGFNLEDPDKEIIMSHLSVYEEFSCDNPSNNVAKEDDCRAFMADGGNVSGKDRYLAEISDIAAHGFNGVWTNNDPDNRAKADQIVSNYVFRGVNGRVVFSDAYPNTAWSVYSQDAYDAMNGAYTLGFLDKPPSFTTRDEPGYLDLLTSHLQNIYDHNIMGADSFSLLFYDTELCLRDNSPVGNPGDGCETPEVLAHLEAVYPANNRTTEAPDCPSHPSNPNNICEPAYYPQLDFAVLNLESTDPDSSSPAMFDNLLAGGTNPANPKLPSQQELYYWQINVEDPRINRYNAGYFLFLTGLDGFFPFPYNQTISNSDPFNDFDGFGGTPIGYPGSSREKMTSYPSSDGPVSTVQWEALREGIDDYRYLQTWMNLQAAMVDENSNYATASYEALLGEDGALDDFRANLDGVLANNTIADFEVARAAVIDEIETLQQGLADDDGDGLSNAAEALANTDPNHPDSDRDGISDGSDIAPTDRFSPNASGTNLSLVADFSDPDVDDSNLTVSSNDTIYVEVWDSQLNGTRLNVGPSYIKIATGGIDNDWDSCTNTTSNTVCDGSTGALSLSTGPHLLELRVKTKGNGNGQYNDSISITAQ